MISSGDHFELKILDTVARVERVWGSGVKTCGTYWIGLEKVAYFVMPGFALVDGKDAYATVLIGGKIFSESSPKSMDEAMSWIEKELECLIRLRAYGKLSLRLFQHSTYFNRGEMPVEFEMEK